MCSPFWMDLEIYLLQDMFIRIKLALLFIFLTHMVEWDFIVHNEIESKHVKLVTENSMVEYFLTTIIFISMFSSKIEL